MLILELAAQGVLGFSPSARVELPSGYVVLIPPSRAPNALAGFLSALLFPDGRGGESAYLAPGHELGNASIMFRGNDQAAYYLARELGGAGAIHRANEATGQWELLTDETTELAEYLRSHVGVPSKKNFEHAFSLTPIQFPSRRPKPKSSAHVESAAARLAPLQSVTAPTDVHSARAKLFELMKELDLSQEIEHLQFKLDGIIRQLSEVETHLAHGGQLRASLQQAEAAYAGAPTVESLKLPKDIAERAKRFPLLLAKREEALSKLDMERNGEISLRSSSIEPLHRNPRFWAGIATGTAFFVGGVMLHGAGRYLTLLDIPAFGFSALLALRHVDDLQRSERQSRRGDRMAAREKKIADDFEAEAQWVKKAMAALKVESPDAIVEILSQKSQLAQRLQELRAQVEALERDSAYASAVAKEQELRREREAIEAKMAEKGGYVREASEVEREIDRIKKSIEAAERGSASPAQPSPAPSLGMQSPSALEDPFPALLNVAADVLMVDATTAGNLIRDRCAQYFSTLTERRYGGLELDRAGKAHVLGSGQKTPARELPPSDLDLLYLSGRLALIEQSASRGQTPIVIEDLSAVFDGAKLALLSRIFKHLGTVTQLLQVTSSPALPALADAAVNL